jgi:hypothetical protein
MEKGPLLRHDFVISTGAQRSGDLRFPLPPAPILTGAIKGLIFLVTTRARWFAMKVSPSAQAGTVFRYAPAARLAWRVTCARVVQTRFCSPPLTSAAAFTGSSP